MYKRIQMLTEADFDKIHAATLEVYRDTGIVFHDFDANGLRWAMNTAMDFYSNRHAWKQIVHNGMQKNYSWSEQGAKYVEQFRKLLK